MQSSPSLRPDIAQQALKILQVEYGSRYNYHVESVFRLPGEKRAYIVKVTRWNNEAIYTSGGPIYVDD